MSKQSYVTVRIKAASKEKLETAVGRFNSKSPVTVAQGAVVSALIDRFAKLTYEEQLQMLFQQTAAGN